MSARAAYISSFATTGILVGSALLVLAVMSAIFAYREWPDGAPAAPPVGVGLHLEGIKDPVAPSALRIRSAPLARGSIARATTGLARSRPATVGIVKLPAAGAPLSFEDPAQAPAPLGFSREPAAPRHSQTTPGPADPPFSPPDPPTSDLLGSLGPLVLGALPSSQATSLLPRLSGSAPTTSVVLAAADGI